MEQRLQAGFMLSLSRRLRMCPSVWLSLAVLVPTWGYRNPKLVCVCEGKRKGMSCAMCPLIKGSSALLSEGIPLPFCFFPAPWKAVCSCLVCISCWAYSKQRIFDPLQANFFMGSDLGLKGFILESQAHGLVCRNYRTSDVNARNKASTRILGFNSVLRCRLAVGRNTFSCINLGTFELQMTKRQ